MDDLQHVLDRPVVIGAGLMGTGIAHGLLLAGGCVTLVDVDGAALAKAQAKIEDIFAGGVRLGKMEEAAAARCLSSLTLDTDLAKAAKDATLAVETATENIGVKLDILSRIDPILAAGAIIGTNTSALSVTELAAAVADPSRVIGMHFFNPVHKMKLLELVIGLETGKDTIAKARAVGKAMTKTVIEVADSPGLTTSRMSAILGNEAMYMLAEGLSSAEDIDTALRLGFNHPMGPLELGDLTGWDTRLKVLQYLHSVLGDKFRPCPLITKMVKAGRIGRKVGRGVYLYDDSGQRVSGSGLKASAL